MRKNEIARRLHGRFTIIWGDKHTSRFTDESLIEMWIEDWSDGIEYFHVNIIKEAIDYCKLNLDWPPSLSEFIKICERSLNIPTAEECLELSIKKDFSNEFVKVLYEKIGSWNVRNDSQQELIKKFKYHHEQELSKSRLDRLKEKKQISSCIKNLQEAHK